MLADVLTAPMPKIDAAVQATQTTQVTSLAKSTQAEVASNTLAPTVRDALTAFALNDTGPAPVADAPLKLPNGEPAQWRQPLQQALGERLQLNTTRSADTAVIRLAPPQMGQVDIAIRHEAGALKVSLSATHPEVLRQLQSVGEGLRHDLSQRHAGEVSVQVSEASGARFAQADADARRQRQGQDTPGDNAPHRAWNDEDNEHAAFSMGRDEERTA
jgi:flagellar hook-length control protein FliK